MPKDFNTCPFAVPLVKLQVQRTVKFEGLQPLFEISLSYWKACTCTVRSRATEVASLMTPSPKTNGNRRGALSSSNTWRTATLSVVAKIAPSAKQSCTTMGDELSQQAFSVRFETYLTGHRRLVTIFTAFQVSKILPGARKSWYFICAQRCLYQEKPHRKLDVYSFADAI